MVLLAVVLYLLPVACWLVASFERERPLWRVALDIPTAVGADVLVVLLFARVVPLETAAFASRPLAFAVAAFAVWRKQRSGRFGRPRVLGLLPAWIALFAAAVAVALSLYFSRRYHIWDRFWHVSLVSSLRGQRLPFSNVYEPGHPLAYHYSGDAIAAMLQSFSLGSLHASHALSLAHDIVYGLTGATLGLFFAGWGARGALTATLSSLALFLAGPSALLRADGQQFAGYNFVNFYTLSFRPHVPVAGLLLVGFVGALLVRLREPRETVPTAHTAVPLTVVTASLAISDEASVGLLGLALGAAWLVYPDAVAPKRLRGLLVLLGLLAAVVIASSLYAGFLSPGAPRPVTKLVDWRSPGFANPVIPFAHPGGLAYFLGDVFALLVFAVAGAWAAVRAFSREVAASAVFVGVLVLAGLLGLARLDIAPRPVEAHRFITAAMLAGPLVGIFWWRWRRERRLPGHSPVVRGLVAVAVALPALSTVAFMRSPGKTSFVTPASFNTKEDFYETDCRTELGGGLGLRPEPLYISRQVFFVYTGCRPAFMPGSTRGRHEIKTSWPLFAKEALTELDRDMVAEGGDLGAICARPSNDSICRRAQADGPCTPVGKTSHAMQIERCTLTAKMRTSLLGQAQSPKPRTPRAPAEPPPPTADSDESPAGDAPDESE